ncbi:transglycosylase domain-containing protein [Subsaxibacter sp. CAU 1640]|uniref:transglycosylase domain-containing protein n=1 Tax=Subsaxibacter sp. CAU 1640 TaxID=2933271 RepID=UPI002006300C|nr:transglycosylase domain-containing protein [Subsaxibacter sp. CAU 1640]MCK7590029.1 transglycosylase domain-containing protein [Subsaxibacter sp. CAU 1640]
MKLNKKRLKKFIKPIGFSLLGLLLAFICFYASIYFGLWGKIPSSETIADLKQSQATQILDRNEDLIGKLYIYDRQSIKYSDFPQHLLDALIATEDVRFYEHNGVDNKSLLRVFFKSILLSDDSSGGGSTITLQLAKNLFGRDRSGAIGLVVNKIKESIVAKRIEKIYSKKEILTMYLNTVPFPDNTYGIESASEKFFNVRTKDLSLVQSAILVGSLKANHYYNPRLFPDNAKQRKNVVLQQMVNYGYLDTEKANVTKQEDIVLDYEFYAPNQGLAPYFRAEIKKQLDTILEQKQFRKPNGDKYNLFHDGLKIYTTLDNTMQRYAEEAMREHMKDLQNQYERAYGKNAPWLKNKPAFIAAKKRLERYKALKSQGLSEKDINDSLSKPYETELFSWDDEKGEVQSLSTLDSLEYYMKFLNAGMISLDPKSGEIRSYVGGIDYRYFQFDHISQSKRQVGSTFKPIVYTAALENGMPPCTYFPTKAITYTDVDNWTPTNSSDIPDDDNLNYSLEKALSNSVNTVAVKVLYETGIETVINQAHKMGIKSDIEEVPSIALGSANLSMIELAKVYTPYVNESVPSTPIFITKIEDKNGNLIASFEDLYPKAKNKEKAFKDETRQAMLEFMKATVNEGTANRLRSKYQLNNAIAGKTGTTQDNKDGWFVGITPKLITVTWVGNDNQQIGFSSTGIGQGANSALPIFAKYFQKLNSDSNYNAITQASFEETAPEVLNSLDCEPTKKDGFFKRLFKSDKDTKTFEKKEKKGIFSWLKKKKE